MMGKNWLKTYWRAVYLETGKHGSEGACWKSASYNEPGPEMVKRFSGKEILTRIRSNSLACYPTKTFRTFGCGIWMAEQDLIRLTGGEGRGDLSGHSIIGNSVFQLFFHHESAAAEVVAQTFPNVAPYKDMLETIQRPQETGVAEAVLRIPDGAYHCYMLLSDTEQRVLIGS